MTNVPLGQNIARAGSGSLIEVSPAARALGAEVCNVDVRSFDDWAFAALMRALLRHQVLLVQSQDLRERDLSALRDRIGAADMLYTAHGMAFDEPASFCSLHAAYDALPPALRRRIAELKIMHQPHEDYGILPDDTLVNRSALQPLVTLHPDTGRTMLSLGQRKNAHLVGLEATESEALLDELWEFVQRPEFAWSHMCRSGDLLIWDDRCTIQLQELTRPSTPRLLHRAEIWSSMPV